MSGTQRTGIATEIPPATLPVYVYDGSSMVANDRMVRMMHRTRAALVMIGIGIPFLIIGIVEISLGDDTLMLGIIFTCIAGFLILLSLTAFYSARSQYERDGQNTPAVNQYPPPVGSYPSHPTGHLPQSGAYPPNSTVYPPQSGVYPPQSGVYPPHSGVYPSQPGGYQEQIGAYPEQLQVNPPIGFADPNTTSSQLGKPSAPQANHPGIGFNPYEIPPPYTTMN